MHNVYRLKVSFLSLVYLIILYGFHRNVVAGERYTSAKRVRKGTHWWFVPRLPIAS